MTRKDIPNAISLVRIGLVMPVVYCLLERHFTAALLIFSVAGLSDALDGYLAKKYDWTSRLGSFLDPLADKLLLVCSFVSCVMIGIVPLWLFAVILARDVVVGMGALVYHLTIEKFKGAPPFSSKLNTALQVFYIVVLLSGQTLIQLPDLWFDYLLYAVVCATVISGAEYIWVWGLRAWEIRRGKHHGQ